MLKKLIGRQKYLFFVLKIFSEIKNPFVICMYTPTNKIRKINYDIYHLAFIMW